MKLNKKGFTLVELLVTIVIVGLIIGLSVFGIIKVINNSKDKVTILSEKNLKEAARIYSGEADSDSWKKNDNFDAFCVTVGELMNKGLLDKNAKINDDIDRNDYIIVKRNRITLAIDKEEIVTDSINDENNLICTGQIDLDNEEYTAPSINGSISYTDRIEINFNSGSAESGIKEYKCLYGESSGNVNKEGIIDGNKCILDGLRSGVYYVFIYMNTNNGSSILATGDKEYSTKDLIKPTIILDENAATITYDDSNILEPSHYFKLSVDGNTNVNVEKCTLKNNEFTCNNGDKQIEKNTWYKVNGNNVNITYDSENNNIELIARIQDGSNNYKEEKKNIIIERYTVKFYKNKASSVDGNTDEYIEKNCISTGNETCKIISPGIVAPSGYDVIGWNTNINANSSIWNIETEKEITSNLSYYAIIKPILYTITYNLNGGTNPSSGVVTSYNIETATFNLPIPTKDGNTFGGWYTNEDLTGTAVTQVSKGSTGNKIFYAKWAASDYAYNIVYKTSSGKELGNDTISYKYGTTNTISPKSFTGYTSPSSQSVKWDSTSAKTITFIYEPISYAISYNLDGGTNPSSGVVTSYNIETATFNLPIPTKVGNTFGGWYTNSDLSGTAVTQITKGSTGNKAFYAKWNANSYTYNIVYKTSSGKELGNDTISYKYGTTNTISPKSFTGYTSPSSQSVKWDSTSAKTITFIYTPITYNIAYTLNGGTVGSNAPTSATYDTLVAIDNPTRTGYTFAGWTSTTIDTSTAYLGDTRWSDGSIKVTSTWFENLTTTNGATVTLIANWTPKVYEVTLNSNGASSAGTATIYYVYGNGYYLDSNYTKKMTTSSNPIIIPVKSGYLFNGYNQGGVSSYYINSSGYATDRLLNSTVSYDFTLSAIWTPEAYPITYDLDGGSVSGNPTSYDIETDTFTLNNPTKEGYTFSGWTGSNGTIPSTSVSITKGSTGAKSYTANWTPNTNTAYVVKHWQQNIDADTTQNSTNYTLKDTENKTGTTGASVTPAVKSYTGFTSPSTQTTTILADGSRVINYYYTRNSYTVTLTKGTGISAVSGAGSYHYGKTVNIDATVSAGYTWKNWSGTHSTTTKAYSFTMPASNVNDTANATANSAAITIKKDGSAYSGLTVSLYQSSTSKYASPTYASGVYTFSAVANGTYDVYVGGSDTGTNVTVSTTGSATINYYTLTLKRGTGIASVTGANTYLSGTKVSIRATASNGYKFSSWTLNSGTAPASTTTASTTVTIAATTTLVANGTLRTYAVSYDANGGTGAPTSQTKTYGVDLTLTTDKPSRAGYEFLGWYPNSSTATSPTVQPGDVYSSNAAVTYYAVWKQKVYVVYYSYDNSLRFYKRDVDFVEGNTYNGMAITNVFNLDENYEYTSAAELPWASVRSNIKTVVFEDIVSPISTASWFANFSALTTVSNMNKLNTTNVTNMYRMFMSCSSLTSLDLSNFDTSNVERMDTMFADCQKLKKLDLSSFDTTNVTNMATMFSDCLALEEINFGENFDTSNVTNMRGMFQKCYKISSLDLSSFNTSKVENMSHMFNKCYELKSLNFGNNFDTSSVTDMSWMFTLCKSLGNIDLSGFNTSNVTNMGGMFNECYSLTELDLSSFDTSNVTIMNGIGTSVEGEGEVTVGMFYMCENLTTIYVSELWDVSKVTPANSINMFAGAFSLKGGAGTEYNQDYVDVTYARVDDPSSGKPGYLTYKALN